MMLLLLLLLRRRRRCLVGRVEPRGRSCGGGVALLRGVGRDLVRLPLLLMLAPMLLQALVGIVSRALSVLLLEPCLLGARNTRATIVLDTAHRKGAMRLLLNLHCVETAKEIIERGRTYGNN
jgi:hypothetical protein